MKSEEAPVASSAGSVLIGTIEAQQLQWRYLFLELKNKKGFLTNKVFAVTFYCPMNQIYDLTFLT